MYSHIVKKKRENVDRLTGVGLAKSRYEECSNWQDFLKND